MPPRAGTRGFAIVALLATVVYWMTAYPTISWWDSSQYSIAAATMGIAGPPGSLMLAMVGWPVAHLPLGLTPARELNLLAGIIAALSAGGVYLVALRMLREAGVEAGVGAAGGAVLGALTFAFGATLWEHAVKFTPYVLTALFTVLILHRMTCWWRDADGRNALRHIALLGLLFGLDFSVHRTNALLIPGVLLWIAIRHPDTLRRPRTWVTGTLALMAGLSLQLLMIPVARFTHSPLSWNAPRNAGLLWDYVSIKQLGGGFLVELFPRKSGFWTVQAADLIRVLRDNFAHVGGAARWLGALGALAALAGICMLWRKDRKLGAAFVAVLLSQAAFTVIYFNIPADFFRSLDRHYLPVCVTTGVAVACGLAFAVQQAVALVRRAGAHGAIATGATLFARFGAAALGAAALAAPVAQLVDNWRTQDASNRWFAADFARNVLGGLPPNAILFTVGDNDTFPLLYMQGVEGVRRDVQLVNLSTANVAGYAEQLLRLDPSLPFSMTSTAHHALAARPWRDTVLSIPVTGTAAALGLPSGSPVPAAITLHARPTYEWRILPADAVLLDIVRTNQWRRPLAFSITAPGSSMGWLEPFGRLDGLYWRIVPVESPVVDPAVLAAGLARNRYRGYADTTVIVDGVAAGMGRLYHQAVETLLDAEIARGSVDRCRAMQANVLAAVPPARIGATTSAGVAGKRCTPGGTGR